MMNEMRYMKGGGGIVVIALVTVLGSYSIQNSLQNSLQNSFTLWWYTVCNVSIVLY